MTQVEISSALNIARSTLLRLRKDFPGAPALDDDLDLWRAFVNRHLVFDAERRRKSNPHALDREQKDGEHLESEFDANDLRREQVIKLRLHNETAREELKLVRRETISVFEAKETLERIKERVSNALAKMRAQIAPTLAGRSAAEIQQILETETRKVLDRLSHPEIY